MAKAYIYTIKNDANRGKAFRAWGGLHIVHAGEEEVVGLKAELTEEQIDAYKSQGVKIKEGGGRSKAVNKDILPPEDDDSPQPAAAPKGEGVKTGAPAAPKSPAGATTPTKS